MFAELYVDGVICPVREECPDSVSLQFDRWPEHRCRACGEELTETADGLCTDSGEYLCPDYDPSLGPDSDCTDGPHDAERVPLSWCNSATLSTDQTDDAVTVSISVGDPRGAFTFTIRRVPDHVDGPLAGQLIMHVPYEDMTSPHMPLTQLHDGTCVIGNPYRIHLMATGRPTI
nr:hypothetical protein [Kibdelosporangium sp. MJ126-NF4]